MQSGQAQTTVEVIRPADASVETVDAAPKVELLAYDALFTRSPLSMASYPAIAFRLRRASPEVLKSSLAAALAAQPILAGRLNGSTVALTNEGVPFTLSRAEAPSAPEALEEAGLLAFADFRRPGCVARGLEPLMTVKLTVFKDGSAILGFCRSHGLLDGSSAWAFLGCWAAAARGEAARPPAWDRAAVRALLPSEDRLQELAQEELGKPLLNTWKSWAMRGALRTAMPLASGVLNSLFLHGLSGVLARPRLFFSHEEVARIKAAATPAAGSPGDGWVSTQEALSAHLLLTIGRAVLPAGSEGRAQLLLLLDARKSLGLPASECFGSGIVFVVLRVKGLLQLTLAEVASAIHEEAAKQASPEAQRRLWQLMAGAAERGLELDVALGMQPSSREYDLQLQLNNQSKRAFPDFGEEGSGGLPQAVVTNAGPSLVLPAKGGVEVLLDPGCLKASGGSRTAARALAALRAELPLGPEAGTWLLGRCGAGVREMHLKG